jgi:hypothetical protein
MCLGVPGRIVSVKGAVAVVDFWGVRREVSLDLVAEPVSPGPILNRRIRDPPHPGRGHPRDPVALRGLLKEAAATISWRRVRGEIAGTGGSRE